MTFEVEYTIIREEEHISVHTAWISARNVTECKTIAEELSHEIEHPENELCVHIGELNC